MEKFNIKYTLTPELFKSGMITAGAFKPQRGKQILITILCLFLIVNSVSAIFETGKIAIINIFYVAIALIAGIYIWVSPYLMLKNIMKKHSKTEEIEAEFSEDGLIFNKEEPQTITRENYNGFIRKNGFMIIYFGRTYEAIPDEALPAEISEKIVEYLEKLTEIPKTQAQKKDDYDNPEFGIWSPENAKSALEELDKEKEDAKLEEKEENELEGENLSDE